MAKLEKLSDEMQDKIYGICKSQGLASYLTIEMMSCRKQRLPIVVSRANASTEFLTEKGTTLLVFVNEPVLEKLSDEQQTMIITDALSGVYLDSESGKLVIAKPEIVCSCWGKAKYGEKLFDALETFVLTSQQMAEEEIERKAAEKGNKKKGNAE